MSKKNALLMPKFRENSYFNYNFQEEFNKDNTNNINSLSFHSEVQIFGNPKNDNDNQIQKKKESDSNSIEIIDDDAIQEKLSDNKSNEKKKSVLKENSYTFFHGNTKLNKKRKKKNNKNVKNDNEQDKEGKREKSPIQNCLPELDDCYEKLKVLISRNNFVDVAFNIIKIFNGISENDKAKDKLLNEIVNITSNIRDKNIIVMMCLSILSSNNSLNNKIIENPKERKEKIDEIPESTDYNDDNLEENSLYEEFKEIDEEKEIKQNKNQYDNPTFINGMINFNNNNYLFGNHFYKKGKIIHCFKPKKNKFSNSKTFSCYRKTSGCNAECVVDKTKDIVTMKGIHNHDFGYPTSRFFNKYPYLMRKKWKHIQIFKVNDIDFIVFQR